MHPCIQINTSGDLRASEKWSKILCAKQSVAYLVNRKYHAQEHVLNVAPLQRFKVSISVDCRSMAWNNCLAADDFIQSSDEEDRNIIFFLQKLGVRKAETTQYLLRNTIKVKALTYNSMSPLSIKIQARMSHFAIESPGHQTAV